MRVSVRFSMLLLALPTLVAAGADPTGRWNGSIDVPGGGLVVAVDLARSGEAWQGTIDIPAQGAEGLPLDEIAVEGEQVRFRIAAVPGAPTFVGTLDAEGATIDGQFTQSGQSFPFRLQRGEPAAPRSGGDSSAAARFEGYDGWVTEMLDTWDTPAVGIALIEDGALLRVTGFGLRDVERGEPADADTLFAIGSTTKAFTATLLALLVEEGLVAWDDPVRSHLPEFELADPVAGRAATIRDLLTHRTGLPRHDLSWYGSDASRATLIERFDGLESSHGFRERFQYQNLMYMAAGELAARVAESSWDELVRRRLFEPLGMAGANVSVAELERVANRATGYASKGGDGPLERVPYRTLDAVAPAGSINASARDMARWLELQIGRGGLGETRLIQPGLLSELHAPQVVVPAGDVAHTIYARPESPLVTYGMGWFVQTYRGRLWVHHGGNIDGFSALVSFLPDERDGVVVLANSGTPFLPLVLALDAHDRMLGHDGEDWSARLQPIRQLLLADAKLRAETPPADRVADAPPAHPLGAYAGEYEHRGYGSLRVSADGEAERLALAYNALEGPLEAWHYDVFRVGAGAGKGLMLRFSTNARGDIDAVHVSLEPALPELRFTRLPPEQLSDPSFLARLAGEYRLSGVTVNVRLRQSTLSVTVVGQPTYDLVPYRDTTFDLDGLSGYTARFELGEQGPADRLVFRQPNGEFVAQRRE